MNPTVLIWYAGEEVDAERIVGYFCIVRSEGGFVLVHTLTSCAITSHKGLPRETVILIALSLCRVLGGVPEDITRITHFLLRNNSFREWFVQASHQKTKEAYEDWRK